MAKNMQNENYKKKNTKQPSKSNVQYSDYKPNEKLNNRASEINFKYSSQGANQNNSKRVQSSNENFYTDNNKSNAVNKKNETNVKHDNEYMETKIKNNFTIRGGFRRKQEIRRKCNDMSSIEHTMSHNRNSHRIENKNDGFSPKQRWSAPDHYLEAGTYEGEDLLMKVTESREKLISDDDSYSMISEISDLCQREQFNVECYNYYLNFGDPYVMTNGEISPCENNWYDRQSSYGRVFYYRSQFNDICYESMRYNYPNHQEFKYRNIDPFQLCNPRGICMNSYVGNGYATSYVEPGLIPNEYYPYQMTQPQEYIQDRYYKGPLLYEEPEDVYNPLMIQENDTLNVINLNSSLFVYNSNVHINAIHQDVYDTNTVTTNDNPSSNSNCNISNIEAVESSCITDDKEVSVEIENEFPTADLENSN